MRLARFAVLFERVDVFFVDEEMCVGVVVRVGPVTEIECPGDLDVVGWMAGSGLAGTLACD